ncbi:MAG: polysaccharide deacetylase family protein [Elusimicrobia bacterium]|nr:polysaccharide deacetylase family protein [Elusimicrobiota bacterium]
MPVLDWVKRAVGCFWECRVKIGARRPKGLSFVVYHHIPNRNWNRFARQIAFIKKEYGFINPHEFAADFKQDRDRGASGVILTFDDGFYSSYQAARAILKEYEIKALYFIPSGFLCAHPGERQKEYIARYFFCNRIKAEHIPDEMRMMSWEDVRWLAREGHTLGAHTISHPRLSEITDQGILCKEIVESGNEIEHHAQVAVEWFAFPFGHVDCINSYVFRFIRERYRFCCSCVRGRNPAGFDPYAIRRDPIAPNYTCAYIRFLLDDGLGPYYASKARRLLAVVADNV